MSVTSVHSQIVTCGQTDRKTDRKRDKQRDRQIYDEE
jgi:hypothetical protein